MNNKEYKFNDCLNESLHLLRHQLLYRDDKQSKLAVSDSTDKSLPGLHFSTCTSTVSLSTMNSTEHWSQPQEKSPPQAQDSGDAVDLGVDVDFDSNPMLATSTLSPPSPRATMKKLRLLPLAILVFYNVSGGPFGIEPSLYSAGNLYTIIGFIIVPFIWSIPEALITAELGSIFCHDSSGGVAWVDEAFGEKWGLVCGYLSWISGATDNAIYPTLFLHYVFSVLQRDNQSQQQNGYHDENYADFSWYEDNNYMRFGFVSTLSILLALLNYRGLEIVGNASIAVCVIAMSPFVIMTFMGIPQIDPSRWFQLPDPNILNHNCSTSNVDDDYYESLPLSWLDKIFPKGVLWTPFLNNLFWNLNSFDSASSFAGEVQSVGTTYPSGIFIGLILSILFYLVPLLVVTGSTDYKQCEWVDGQLGNAAIDIGGSWLGSWIVFAAGISNLALFEAELSSDSYQLMGMAERGHLPKIFAKRSERFDTPTFGILICTLVIIAMSIADFTKLVELLNFNYAIALLMEYAAFVKLRYTRKDCK